MKNFITKHSDGLSILGLCSLFIVADAEPNKILTYLIIPAILLTMGTIGNRIKNTRESEEL